MLNIGLTGGIASGKSTVAGMLVKKGAHLIDFDKLAHELMKPEKPAWKQMVGYFGREIIGKDGKIDRVKLGKIVFADKRKLNRLNKIIHPLVYQEWYKQLEKICRKEKHAIVLADIPLLFEGKMQHLFDLTVLVLIEPEEQIRRLMARSMMNRTEAEKRLESQMPISKKISLADIVIDNSRTVKETKAIVNQIWGELVRREKEKSN